MANIVNHPLIEHKLTQLRCKTTNTRNFRANLNEIAGLLVYEISRDLPLKEVQIETPIQETHAKELSKDIVLVPIMRAGLGMVEGIANLITDILVFFVMRILWSPALTMKNSRKDLRMRS